MKKLEQILAKAKNFFQNGEQTMNLSVKKMPWVVTSLLAVTSVFGQNQSQNQGSCAPQPTVCKPAPRCSPLQAPQKPVNCAYNAPAETNVGMQGDYDFFASGSFVYWQPSQDNMDIALTNSNAMLSLPAGSTEGSFKGGFVEMNFKYTPGFKVGLGMNLQTDDWDGYAEYTRVHGTHSASTNGPLFTPSVFPTFGHPFAYTVNGSANVFNSAYANYTNNLDFADVEMGRTYYVGKSLIFRSAYGARAAWILQNIHVKYNNNSASASNDVATQIHSVSAVVDVYQRTHSWAVGPRAGLCMDWMLGSGIRFFGNGYADLLYTSYKVQDKTVEVVRGLSTSSTNSLVVGSPFSVVTYDKVGTVRTHLDFEMGFGWGSYFHNNNWHVDLSASYGWQVFFGQNMFPHFNSGLNLGNNTRPHGDLFVQGLTATARLDF